MRIIDTSVATTLLALSLTGCSYLHLHRSSPAQAPPLQTGQGKLEEQQKQAHQGPPPSGLPQPSAQESTPQLPPEKMPKVRRAKKKKSAENASSSSHQQSAVQPESTAPAQAAPASPIGQLTTGDGPAGAQAKQDALNLITQTEDRLKKIDRQLSTEEQKTTEQVRTFLKQARQALDVGDADGAQTLATKAKLLLDELNKS